MNHSYLPRIVRDDVLNGAQGGASPVLLVSVRSIQEAQLAADCGAGVIDFKEPSRGPLAPVAESIWKAAVEASFEATLSAALGEADTAIGLAAQVPAGFRFAKVGPSGAHSTAALAELWEQLQLNPDVELVPVAYADHDAAKCINPHQVLDLVIRQHRSRLLIDTFVKDGRGLLDHIGLDELSQLVQRAREANVWIALAGSLCIADMQEIAGQGCLPDCVGVRGDVCKNSVARTHVTMKPNGLSRDATESGLVLGERRMGRLCRARIEAWLATLGQLV
ncbi:hypothetical protein SAMN06265222_10324 [Neorhodopirellula lusitana]|uniref:(5-formylfuran-3-yl)methyl phosphate synthase n=1 Tax=Neorhodopirellula lusitana TaxID=445327 RepID=A0ABY1PVD8_9BACT|nr:(5-formylfuran-3-yl)methyl phosphate synthase [Neorhodopirellula lusitana]SMP50013.1 hypothetical protein SAMN06265222_10324 [Neorhodopirellula lusitana]